MHKETLTLPTPSGRPRELDVYWFEDGEAEGEMERLRRLRKEWREEMAQLSHEEFLEKVKERFGDKIRVDQLKTKEEDAAKLKLTKKEIEEYPAQAWLIYKNEDGYELCPNCDEPLFGLFGSFEWGLAHGHGFCTKCKKVGFRYYHYIGEPEKQVKLLSVSSF